MEKYNVYIVDISTGRAVSIIGKGLTDDKAEAREITGISRINTSVAFVDSVEVGSEKDAKYSSQI